MPYFYPYQRRLPFALRRRFILGNAFCASDYGPWTLLASIVYGDLHGIYALLRFFNKNEKKQLLIQDIVLLTCY